MYCMCNFMFIFVTASNRTDFDSNVGNFRCTLKFIRLLLRNFFNRPPVHLSRTYSHCFRFDFASQYLHTKNECMTFDMIGCCYATKTIRYICQYNKLAHRIRFDSFKHIPPFKSSKQSRWKLKFNFLFYLHWLGIHWFRFMFYFADDALLMCSWCADVLHTGPCGGKTTGQSRMCTFFENLGWKVSDCKTTFALYLLYTIYCSFNCSLT